MSKTQKKPRIIVSEQEHDRLLDLATSLRDRMPGVAGELIAELDRARVVAPKALPAGVVRMGSTVEFQSDDGQQRRITLVFPGQADIAAGKVSIMTPIGTALIGLSAGQTIDWTARDGRRQNLTVLTVEQAGG